MSVSASNPVSEIPEDPIQDTDTPELSYASSSDGGELPDWKYSDLPMKVFFCLTQSSIPRKWCIALVRNPWFDRVTMMVIIVNCLLMALYKPCEDDLCQSTRCKSINNADHCIFAYFAIEMCITMEGWTDVMYAVQDGQSFWSWIYFFILMIIGAFFMVQLFLVVITDQFSVTKNRELEKMKQEEALDETKSEEANDEKSDPDSLYITMIHKITKYGRKVGRIICSCCVKDRMDTPVVQYSLGGRQRVDRPTQADPPPTLFSRAKGRIRAFVGSSHFSRIVLVAILLNTLAMAVEHYRQPHAMTVVLEYLNYCFTAFFVVEMALKIIGLGFCEYISDLFNLFDAIIVIISVVDVLQGGESGGLSVLRSFRLLRILKLVRFLPRLRHQLSVMVATADEIAVFVGIMGLFIFIFALLGMVLFGKKFCKNDKTGEACDCSDLDNPAIFCSCDRMNFDTFLNASLTVFQVLTTEDWNQVLFNGMEMTASWSAGIYFVVLMTIGNFILLNLLIAILVDGMHTTPDDPETEQLPHRPQIPFDFPLEEPGTDAQDKPSTSQQEPEVGSFPGCVFPQYAVRYGNDEESKDRSGPSASPNRKIHPAEDSTTRPAFELVLNPETLAPESHDPQSGSEGKNQRPKKGILDPCRRCYRWSCCYYRRNHSFLLLGPENPVRKVCRDIVTMKWFDYFILFCIFLNCICMALERPSVPPQSTERNFLTIANYVFIGIFTVEMLMKITAFGFLWGPGAYIKDSWNVLDGTLVVISLVTLLFDLFFTQGAPQILGILRILRLLRALRPLRAINRIPSLKLTIQSLIDSFSDIANLLGICATFFLIFGILGTQIFKGTMHYCEGPDLSNVTNMDQCLNSTENRWAASRLNFDNLLQSLMTLFVIATFDGWVVVMHQGIDAVGVDIQPIQNYNQWAILYFIVFLLTVACFVISMFVGVLVDNFQSANHRLKQERRKELVKLAKEKTGQNKEKRKTPDLSTYSGCRRTLYNFVTNECISLFIYGAIVVSVICMATEHYQMPPLQAQILRYVAYGFTGLFVIEATLKIIAMGKYYFYNSGNVLDFSVVLLSVSAIVVELLGYFFTFSPLVGRVLRVVRVFRVLRLLKMTDGLKQLALAVGSAVPQIGNLGLILGLLFFIYGALGVELFGRIECTMENPCEGLNDKANFHHFGMAFLTLFRITTGDNWNGILKDALRDKKCEDSANCEYISPVLAILFFTTFVLFAQLILLNIVVAMLMKGLEDAEEAAAQKHASHYTNTTTTARTQAGELMKQRNDGQQSPNGPKDADIAESAL